MVKGIVRQFDDLGRITIPKEMRKTLKLSTKDPVDIYFKDGVICIAPCRLQCVICEDTNEDKLVVVDEVHVCSSCIQKFRNKLMNND